MPSTPKFDFDHPGLPSRCTWKLGTQEPTVHTCTPFKPELKKTIPNVLGAIGNTPMIKLNRIPQSEGIKCDVYVKTEFFNPGGSVKDRIGLRMIEDAEAKGIMKPGCTVIEPTSGNTGIGLAMACAVKGYKCLIVMPDKMSNEKVYALKALGATIVRTPIEAGLDNPEGLIQVAHRLNKEIKDSVLLDQYRNPGNPLAHYDTTAEEILWQMDYDVDMVVAGAGTGGSIAGIGRKIKEKLPSCKIVAVDPAGSILAEPADLNKTDVTYYEVEGIGYDFVPTVLDRSIVDGWVKTTDYECFPMARRLNLEEGILSGGSSGSAIVGGLKAARQLKEGQKCVILLADGIRNYLTKFVSDNWMEARGLKEVVNEHNHWWWNKPISELNLSTPIVVEPTVSCQEVINILKNNNLQHIPIYNSETRTIIGAVTMEVLLNQIVSFNLSLSAPISKAMYKKSIKVPENTILGKLARVLEMEELVIITKTDSNGSEVVSALANKMDMLAYISTNGQQTNGKGH